MRALSSRPFCPCESRQAGLLYLPARWRYTTRCPHAAAVCQSSCGLNSSVVSQLPQVLALSWTVAYTGDSHVPCLFPCGRCAMTCLPQRRATPTMIFCPAMHNGFQLIVGIGWDLRRLRRWLTLPTRCPGCGDQYLAHGNIQDKATQGQDDEPGPVIFQRGEWLSLRRKQHVCRFRGRIGAENLAPGTLCQEIEQTIVDIQSEVLCRVRQGETHGFRAYGFVSLFAYHAEDILAIPLHGEAALIASGRYGREGHRKCLPVRREDPTPLQVQMIDIALLGIIDIGLDHGLSFAYIHAHVEIFRDTLTLYPAHQLGDKLTELWPVQPVLPPACRQVRGEGCRPPQPVALHGQQGIGFRRHQHEFGSRLAELVLVTPKTDPLLAVQRYGLGRTAAFTSDLSARWGKDWVHWSQFSQFVAQLIRWVQRQGVTENFDVRVDIREGQAVVQADVYD